MHMHLFMLGFFSEKKKPPENIKTTNRNKTLYEEWD